MITRISPDSGCFPVPRVALIDAELRCQGSSLVAFAAEYGATPQHVARVLDGAAQDDRLLVALAERLGVSPRALRAA